MIEVGGKLKTGLLLTSVAVFGALAFSARTSDMVKIKGEACEKFVAGQSRSSIRVRVTDKASYNAVSQIANLADVRSNMLEHDFNVIVYNLVDNYVRDLMVRTTSQDDKELCVKVTGAIPVADIDKVVANYSPNTPAPEYDIKEAAGLEEEVLTAEDELEPEPQPEPQSEVLYSGSEELAQEQNLKQEQQVVSEEKAPAEIVYGGEEDMSADAEVYSDEIGAWQTESDISSTNDVDLEIEDDTSEQKTNELSASVAAVADSSVVKPTPDEALSSTPTIPTPTPMIEYTANVYVGPVEFNNNTHSSKPSQVLKDMFADTDGYRLVDNPQAAMYAFYPKVLKAKVDSLNSQTKRIQMVVSLQLQVKDSNVSYSEHQNRFVLFESGEKEQDIAQKLLHKLLRKAGRKLFDKVEQAEEKRKLQNSAVITPAN